MMRKTSTFILGMIFLLSLAITAHATALTVTLNAPANNSNVTAGQNWVLLNATVINNNGGVNNSNSTVSFYTGNTLLYNISNVSNGSSVTFNYTGLSVGAHTWKVNASSNNGTGTSGTFNFNTYAAPASTCFANATGTTLIVISLIPVFLALFIGLMFLDIVDVETAVGALIAAAFVIPLLTSFC